MCVCVCVCVCVRACVCVFACVHMFLCKQTDYSKVVILFTGEESNSTVCKSSARVPHLHQHLTGWLRSVILALTNLTASHFLPGERPSFLVIKTSFFLLLFFLSQTFFFIIPLNEVITEDHISSNTISA